ncbi:hypothetical protein R3P38DRAFT_3284893 [Favolaschia claudopus]|uniref:Uncharacterized protein n=1 Tax=Favolaschia claudopus TaxID=2862362 RepID=A0AAW0A4S4_9AGAR
MSENVDPPSPHDKSEAPTKRGRGRPKGSKNKSAAAGAVEQEDPAPVIPRIDSKFEPRSATAGF